MPAKGGSRYDLPQVQKRQCEHFPGNGGHHLAQGVRRLGFLDTARLRDVRAHTDYTASDQQQNKLENALRGGLQHLRKTLAGMIEM